MISGMCCITFRRCYKFWQAPSAQPESQAICETGNKVCVLQAHPQHGVRVLKRTKVMVRASLTIDRRKHTNSSRFRTQMWKRERLRPRCPQRTNSDEEIKWDRVVLRKMHPEPSYIALHKRNTTHPVFVLMLLVSRFH